MRSLGLVLIIVFFATRYLLRDRLEVREAPVGHEVLRNTISTNGHVEPEVNYQFYSPIATTVKAVYVQPGDKVPAGKLLMVLDDVEARARLATAESGVKSAQAAVEAATQTEPCKSGRRRPAKWPARASTAIRRGTIWRP